MSNGKKEMIPNFYIKLIRRTDSGPWPLKYSIELLIEATKKLLDRHSYDGVKHEEYLCCIRSLEENMKGATNE